MWQVIPYQFPGAMLAMALGYLSLLCRVPDGRFQPASSLKKILVPLGAILVAPLIDYSLKYALRLPESELATVVGVGASVTLAGQGMSREEWAEAISGGKTWSFGLIVLGMFVYLGVFRASGISELIAGLPFPPQALTVRAGFVLGFVTGRVQAPVSILIPVYLAKFGAFGLWAFALTYFAVYPGYLISPVHPCLVVSVEYAGTTLRKVMREMIPPVIIALILTALLSLWGLE